MFCYVNYSGIIYIYELLIQNVHFSKTHLEKSTTYFWSIRNVFNICNYNHEELFVHRQRRKAPKVWKLNMGQAGMFHWKFLMELLL